MITPAVASTPALVAAPAADPPSDVSFSSILHALNPLQYLPVVGTIYRAITGDTLNEAVRGVGQTLVGGLLGGPIGAAIGAASALVQHFAHIDLDGIAHTAMVDAGMLHDDPPVVAEVIAPPVEISPCGSATAAEARVQGLTATAEASAIPTSTALAAYGRTLGVHGPRLAHA